MVRPARARSRTHDPSLSHRLAPRLGCFFGTFSPSRRQIPRQHPLDVSHPPALRRLASGGSAGNRSGRTYRVASRSIAAVNAASSSRAFGRRRCCRRPWLADDPARPAFRDGDPRIFAHGTTQARLREGLS